MAHWAELDENNVVLRVTVGDNNDLDEGYQWIVDNLGGRWLKCSYNTVEGEHLLGGTPFRWTYPGEGYTYYEDIDSFIQYQTLSSLRFHRPKSINQSLVLEMEASIF